MCWQDAINNGTADMQMHLASTQPTLSEQRLAMWLVTKLHKEHRGDAEWLNAATGMSCK